MQIYAKLNDNKSISEYATTNQEGYKALTIDEAQAHFLPEYHSLMWADDNGLVHADNLPATKWEQDNASREARIKQQSIEVDGKLSAMDAKIEQANKAKAEIDAKLANVNEVLDAITKMMPTSSSIPDSANDTTTSATADNTKGE